MDRDSGDLDGPTRRVSPNRLAADLADVSDEAGSLRERDDSARHEPGFLGELPPSAPSRLARDEATRGRSKNLSARGATTHPLAAPIRHFLRIRKKKSGPEWTRSSNSLRDNYTPLVSPVGWGQHVVVP